MELIRSPFRILVVLAASTLVLAVDAFVITERRPTALPNHRRRRSRIFSSTESSSETPPLTVSSVKEATEILSEWDRTFSSDTTAQQSSSSLENADETRHKLAHALRYLNHVAREQRDRDSTRGRCMLGICASSGEEGLSTLKSWVAALELPRGLLHGMDKDGEPLQLDGSVYIKYNTGGSLTFADIRKSGIGFDAIWKPGDALLELYDGTYRGVYFQVELSDGIFRQFLVPLDVFGPLQ